MSGSQTLATGTLTSSTPYSELLHSSLKSFHVCNIKHQGSQDVCFACYISIYNLQSIYNLKHTIGYLEIWWQISQWLYILYHFKSSFGGLLHQYQCIIAYIKDTYHSVPDVNSYRPHRGRYRDCLHAHDPVFVSKISV